ncbi:MAG: tetratricopeptide repeat protein, partial [Planctomycetota bacterium]
TFDPELLAHARKRDRLEVLESLAQVERGTGIVCDAGGAFRFDHHQIQEVLYDQVPETLRAEYHALLARAFHERLAHEPTREEYFFLATHYLRGRCVSESLPHLNGYFGSTTPGHRTDDALKLLDLALKAGSDPHELPRLRLLLWKAQRLNARGEFAEAAELIDEARSTATDSSDPFLRCVLEGTAFVCIAPSEGIEPAAVHLERQLSLAQASGERGAEAQACVHLAHVAFQCGRTDAAEEYAERGLQISSAIAQSGLEADCLLILSDVNHRRGRYAESAELAEQSLAIARSIGDVYIEVKAFLVLANTLWNPRRDKRAESVYERALELSQKCGLRHGTASALRGLGQICVDEGRYAPTLKYYERHRSLARDMGDKMNEAVAGGNVGVVLNLLGAYGAALQLHERALAVCREFGFLHAEAQALSGVAGALEALGRLDQARACLERRLAIAREADMRELEASALFRLADHLYRAGEQSSALKLLDEAIPLAREVSHEEILVRAVALRARMTGVDLDDAVSELQKHASRMDPEVRMRAWFDLWEVTGDATQLNQAWRLLQYLRSHAPEEHRESMLRNVAVYRAIVEAWEEHGGER